MTKRTSRKIAVAEDTRLRDYELVLIINPEIGDEALDALVDNVSQFITGKEGTVSSVERWGKRKLAYPISRFMEGSYVLVRFKLKPALGRELKANLQISEEVLRYLLIRLND